MTKTVGDISKSQRAGGGVSPVQVRHITKITSELQTSNRVVVEADGVPPLSGRIYKVPVLLHGSLSML